MGLTHDSTKIKAMKDIFEIDRKDNQYVVALAGNPNTGKSTVFNTLTGLKQHTGNWPGKTVCSARGDFRYNNKDFALIDLPGTYSLFAASEEEIVARDFACFGKPDALIVVADATSLERNLNLVFQVMELTNKVILCINLIDEARKKGISIDKDNLEKELGIPVVLTSAKNNIGMDKLLETLDKVVSNNYIYDNKVIKYNAEIENNLEKIEDNLKLSIPYIKSRWLGLRLIDGDESIYESMDNYIEGDYKTSIDAIKNILPKDIDKQNIRDEINRINYEYANELYTASVIIKNENRFKRDENIDKVITSRVLGIPIMILCLGIVFFITIQGSNYPSEILADLFFSIEPHIFNFLAYIGLPLWFNEMITYGMYRSLAWVVSVMLPPMAIFFPLFTLLEDLGFLPRVAFNLDHLFKKAGCHGKQCLTMCMGFGCNAAGVIGCRIIDSPREKLIAILTNNFVPCNGRFPLLIALGTIFFSSVIASSFYSNVISALVVTGMIIIGIIITLSVSFLLSKTMLKGVPSTFTLELPPYRTPKIGTVLYTSIIDRTIFVLWRAIIVAAPVGIVIWICANIYIGEISILAFAAGKLDPLANLIGLDGFILLAFILGLPANEIVIPILIMSYLATGSMIEPDNFVELGQILRDNGWTYLTALNVMLFSLLHWPCATTLLTIRKETGSNKWTFVGFILPTIIAFLVCFMTTTVFRILGLG